MALSKFLDPKNDFCFKKIFGTEKNKDILIHFLNDIMYQNFRNVLWNEYDLVFIKGNRVVL